MRSPRSVLVRASVAVILVLALVLPAQAASGQTRALHLSPSPSITGSATIGGTLRALPGHWGPGEVRFVYQWWLDGARLAGQTKETYGVKRTDMGRRLTVTVTGSASGFATTSRSSAPTAPVTAPLAQAITATPVPVISGDVALGRVLTAVPGTWGPGAVQLQFQWLRDGAVIPGAGSARYTVAGADAGRALSVRVTASRGGAGAFARTSAAVRVVPVDPPRDIVVVLGQSNAQGAAMGPDPATAGAVRGLDQLAGSGPSAGRVIPATEPLAHVTTWAGRVGPATSFGRMMLEDAPTGRGVLIVPAAQGSTSLIGDADYAWDPANRTAAVNLYNRAVAQIEHARALRPGNRVAAIIWAQGESDADSTDGATYEGKLRVVLNALRARYGDVPILIGGMVPEWVEQSPSRQAIDAAHRRVAASLPSTAYVPGVYGHSHDGGIHYNLTGVRVMAERYYDAYLGLLMR